MSVKLRQEILDAFDNFDRHTQNKTAAALLTEIYFRSKNTAAVASDLLERKEAAERMRISVTSLDRHIKAGRLPIVRNGRRVFVKATILDEYMSHLDSNPLYMSESELDRILQCN